jgi:hypothetical protein
MKRLEIGNAGSKKVPVLLIGRSRTRSGLKFRNRLPQPSPALSPAQAALLAIQQPLPDIDPVEACALALQHLNGEYPDEETEEVAETDDEEPAQQPAPASPVPIKCWVFDAENGWYRRTMLC